MAQPPHPCPLCARVPHCSLKVVAGCVHAPGPRASQESSMLLPHPSSPAQHTSHKCLAVYGSSTSGARNKQRQGQGQDRVHAHLQERRTASTSTQLRANLLSKSQTELAGQHTSSRSMMLRSRPPSPVEASVAMVWALAMKCTISCDTQPAVPYHTTRLCFRIYQNMP